MVADMPTHPPPNSPNLRAELARAGCTQREIARLLGVSLSYVWLRIDRSDPWAEGELDTIADYLGVPVERLADEYEPSQATG